VSIQPHQTHRTSFYEDRHLSNTPWNNPPLPDEPLQNSCDGWVGGILGFFSNLMILLILSLLHFVLLGFLITEFLKLRSLFKQENLYQASITSIASMGGSNATDVPVVEFIDHSGERISICTRSSSGLYRDWKGKHVDVYYRKGLSTAVLAKPRCMWDSVIVLLALYIPVALLLTVVLIKQISF